MTIHRDIDYLKEINRIKRIGSDTRRIPGGCEMIDNKMIDNKMIDNKMIDYEMIRKYYKG